LSISPLPLWLDAGGGIGQPWLGAPAEAVPFQGYAGEGREQPAEGIVRTRLPPHAHAAFETSAACGTNSRGLRFFQLRGAVLPHANDRGRVATALAAEGPD